MFTRTFRGRTLNEALALVRAELGEQALIIATRSLPRGMFGKLVEVVATLEQPLAAVGSHERAEPQTAEPAPVHGVSKSTESELTRLLAPLRRDLRDLRSMVQALRQQSAPAEVLGLLRRLSARIEAPTTDDADPPAHYATPFEHVSGQRIIALVGARNAGKTMTLAKVAARAALIHDRAVALVACGKALGATEPSIEQLSEVIGIPSRRVFDPHALGPTLRELDAELLLIDGTGDPTRDALLFHGSRLVEVHLVVDATLPARVIAAQVSSYTTLRPQSLSLTKLDLTHAPRAVQDSARRFGLPLAYVTYGRQIPDDIVAAAEHLDQPRLPLSQRHLGVN